MSRKKKNVILQKILVEDYAAEGKSLARVDGKVIFIEGVVPGDVVDVLLGKNKKDWAEGRPMKFHSYSEMRVQPFCPHFGTCGGCQWQMLPYEKQLEYKERQVRDNLQRIAKVPLPEINSICGATQTKFYRNKLEYTFGNKRFLLKEELNDPEISGQQDVAGFHARGMFDKIVNINTCFLQDEPTNAIRNTIREFARSNNYTFYDIRNHVGFLRTMQVRLCRSGELMVNIVFGEDNVEERNRLLDHIKDEFPMITTLLYTINTKRNDSMFDLEPVPYTGKGYVMETLVTAKGEEFRFKIGPKSFFQTNTSQGERLYQIAAEYAELTGNEVVYDLYCGTGSVGIFVSPGARKIIGVEMVEAAIEDAKENASLNNIPLSEFFAGDVIDICTDQFFEQHGRPDVIITDPPRAGMHEKLVRKILDIAAPVVVYISCNPATQARDLAWLDEKYTVTKVQPVDMFPHTLHIENVVQLKLKSLN